MLEERLPGRLLLSDYLKSQEQNPLNLYSGGGDPSVDCKPQPQLGQCAALSSSHSNALYGQLPLAMSAVGHSAHAGHQAHPASGQPPPLHCARQAMLDLQRRADRLQQLHYDGADNGMFTLISVSFMMNISN